MTWVRRTARDMINGLDSGFRWLEESGWWLPFVIACVLVFALIAASNP